MWGGGGSGGAAPARVGGEWGVEAVKQEEKVEEDETNLIPHLTREEAEAVFAALDTNADGAISQIEFVKGLRKNSALAMLLHLPTHIEQESESRTIFQLAFGSMDKDDSKTIDLSEFLAFYAPAPPTSLAPSVAPDQPREFPDRSEVPDQMRDLSFGSEASPSGPGRRRELRTHYQGTGVMEEVNVGGKVFGAPHEV
ncbi:hypothetical protein T484DRAFT_2207523 [Baffinella frigidus]|nr:hypothetical protein T484DRAFT_2207523 [Cryptophyta sp. CCMP2293]